MLFSTRNVTYRIIAKCMEYFSPITRPTVVFVIPKSLATVKLINNLWLQWLGRNPYPKPVFAIYLVMDSLYDLLPLA